MTPEDFLWVSQRLPTDRPIFRFLEEYLSPSISVLIASLDDVHASKRAADRPKDRAYFAAFEERD